MDTESKTLKTKMFQEWCKKKTHWRLKMDIGGDPQLEECDGEVLSPRDDTMEGKEKL